MTKILSELLAAREPDFRLGVQKLEQASGGQSHDIRLTHDVLAATRAKLAELGLDPNDTSGEELYRALAEKLGQSDKELAKVLKLEPLEPDFLEDFAASVRKLAGRNCFALKQTAAKKLLKASPPKKAMKALGYRSLDSFLKHESLAGLFASTKICESTSWQKTFISEYKKLAPSDFEERPVSVTALTPDRWRKLASDYTASRRNNLLTIPEAGTLAILPLAGYQPGMLTAMFLLALADLNEIQATSSYLRLNQFQTDFGKKVQGAASAELAVASPISGEKLSWRVVHEFMTGKAADFELPLANENQALTSPADTLAGLSPALAFWRGTSHLAFRASDGEVVSLNPLDAALDYVNNLPFEQRVNHHFRQNLWRQFWQRYLQAEYLSEKLVASVQQELAGPELAPEFALADELSTGAS